MPESYRRVSLFQIRRALHLTGSKPEEIDAVVTVDEADLEAMRRAVDCYVTCAATIEAHRDGTGIKKYECQAKSGSSALFVKVPG